MPIKYDSVVPWGRSYREYIDMFGLTDEDLNKSILGCGDGPAGFNCVMNRKNKRVISIDPIYQFTLAEIEKRINDTFDKVIEQTQKNKEKFVWTKIKSIEELGEVRISSMKDFLKDYENGKKEGRYIFGELQVLPFTDDQFDLALSSHFLFLYTDNLSLDFHIKSINEMLRVSTEVRIFPLVDLNACKSVYVNEVANIYQNSGYYVSEETVDYEFQIGGNKMLRIIKNK